ncbi:hypothetical protein CALVIDRAFT_560681 [Calocera viscosa TUFC12733]|uniref:Proteasomal ATPase second OB domain-containing protein n=1 Tax=Calocera viscosa (strain TUFC12733) TaxID=1330018 RepID=A0A167QMN7_CALVF|nr:hypothetical protein CALVIDRAFT_560681 [Calocera viscosa TUFC12733]
MKDGQNGDTKDKPPLPTRVGKKTKRGLDAATKLPAVYPTTRCRLKLLKIERIKDYLLLEEELMQNQERLKPSVTEDKNEEERTRVDDLRGSPMGVGSLQEIIDNDHAIISTASRPEYYVSIMSFVDKDLLKPGCTVLLHHKMRAVIDMLQDDAELMLNIMKRFLPEVLNQLDGFNTPRDTKSSREQPVSSRLTMRWFDQPRQGEVMAWRVGTAGLRGGEPW